MWYVIQAKTGDEHKVKLLLESKLDKKYYNQCFEPLYESVRHRQEKSLILLRKLLPGYFFIDTDFPVEVHKALRTIPDFASVLGVKEEKDKEKDFIPISKDDENFLNSILAEGIMRVSYVHLSKSNRIDKVIGPLEDYRNFITKMELRHRYATVEAEIFGKKRKLNFGLWTDQDPKLPWLEEIKEQRNSGSEAVGSHALNQFATNYDIGIHPGDKVEYPEIYGDTVFVVDHVDPAKRIIRTTIEMFGSSRSIEMYADDVKKIG